MDLINAMLWGLSGYDKALSRLVELRQHFQANPAILVHIDAAIATHIDHECQILMPDGLLPDMATEAEQRCPNAEITLRQVWDLMERDTTPAHPAIGLLMGPTPRTDLAIIIATYALALGSYSNFGSAPWRRFVDIVNQESELANVKQ